MTDFNLPESSTPASFDKQRGFIHQRWYAVVDDLIGGYAISTCDRPVSEHDYTKGEVEIGSFFDKQTAEHVVEVHNRWFDLISR